MMQHTQEPIFRLNCVSAQTPPHTYFTMAGAAPVVETLFKGSPKSLLSCYPNVPIPSMTTPSPEHSERPHATSLVSLQNSKLASQFFCISYPPEAYYNILTCNYEICSSLNVNGIGS